METARSIAVIGSARRDGNTLTILRRLTDGYRCDIVDLSTCTVAPYNYQHVYAEHDQFLPLVERIVVAPLTIIATPVYWYSYSTSMKTFIDRFSDLLTWREELARELRGRRFALVSTSAEALPDRTLAEAFCRFCDYLGIVYVGCVHTREAGEFTDPDAVARIRHCLADHNDSIG